MKCGFLGGVESTRTIGDRKIETRACGHPLNAIQKAVELEYDLMELAGSEAWCCQGCDHWRQPPSDTFDRVVVINLARRTDRLAEIRKEFEKGWPFVDPILHKAIDGARCIQPEGYGQGPYAWACFQSHRRAIEDAINDGCNSILILEDDAVFVDGFAEKALKFMADIPEDWEFVWLGGHHMNPPIAVKPGVVQSVWMDRMHAYGARGKGLIDLYRMWHQWHPTHCDHVISRWVANRKSYCAQPWLVGQRGGRSDISFQQGGPNWWPEDQTVQATEITSAVVPQTEVAKKLTFAQRAGSFLNVMGHTALGGFRLLPQADIDERLAICNQCPHHVNGCALCQCPNVDGTQTYLNKLAHPHSVCPDTPPRWGAKSLPAGGMNLGLLHNQQRLYGADGRRPLFSACMPTRGRAAQAVRAVENFYETTKGHHVEMSVLSHPDDAVEGLKRFLNNPAYPGFKLQVADTDAISGWNLAAQAARGDLLKVWDDDLIAQPGWLDAFFAFFDSIGNPDLAYIGLWDDHGWVPHKLFTRAVGTRRFFVEICGGRLTIPKYKSWCDDLEKFDLAKEHHCGHYCPDSKINHLQAGRAAGVAFDATARIGAQFHGDDDRIYNTRKAQGFPQDWLPMFSMIPPEDDDGVDSARSTDSQRNAGSG